MKVLLINGSPNEKGCTWRALKEVADTLEKEGVESEILHIGKKPIGGCIGCGGCSKNNGRCVFNNDPVNEVLDKMETADGLIVGSPVYFASPNGALISLMDRIFMAGGNFRFKPAACVTSARRGGTTSTLEVMNRGREGRGRLTDHAHPWKKHGIYAQMSQGRRRCRRCKTGERGKDQDQLYQISDSYL